MTRKTAWTTPLRALAPVVALALAAACAGHEAETVRVRHLEHPVTDLAALGEVVEVTALETSDAALLGGIDRIVEDPESGDLLVADFRSSEQAVRFARSGELVATYTDATVREADMIEFRALAALPGGRVMLAADDRASVFARDGRLLAHTPVPFAVDAAAVAGDRLYLRGHNMGGRLEAAVGAYRVEEDGSLTEVASFHPYDERRDRFAFQPRHPLAATDGAVYVSGLFEFEVHRYDEAGRLQVTYDLEAAPQPSPAAWEKPRHELTDEDRATLQASVHRARVLEWMGDHLYLVEDDNRVQPVAVHLSLLDPGAGVLHRFPELRPVSRSATPERLTFDDMPGVWRRGFLGVIDDPEKVALLGRRYPRFAGLTYEATDNPLVAFFEVAPLPPAGERVADAVPGGVPADGKVGR